MIEKKKVKVGRVEIETQRSAASVEVCLLNSSDVLFSFFESKFADWDYRKLVVYRTLNLTAYILTLNNISVWRIHLTDVHICFYLLGSSCMRIVFRGQFFNTQSDAFQEPLTFKPFPQRNFSSGEHFMTSRYI